ncbi:lactonase family protein [Undibacterium sp. MH2W]|uniref:lactonase family protein n=1 Tax=Undibacterium sp. MH2W TaxID=3413044 RepID=UPI003BF2562E
MKLSLHLSAVKHPPLRQHLSHMLVRVRIVCVSLIASANLVACGGTSNSTPPSANNNIPVSHASLTGRLMGGRQAIVGSTVYVYDASGTRAGASVQIGAATTQTDGTFSVATLSPAPVNGDLIYLLAVGGDAGGGVNPNATLMSVAGVWGDGNFVSHVQINELTTVAVASKLGSYMAQVPCTSIGGSTATSGTCPMIRGQGGWAVPVANVASLVDVSAGAAALALRTASNPSAAYTTYQNLNLQASVLANCINSVGGTAGDHSACGNLFSVASSQAVAGSLSINGGTFSVGPTPALLTISPNGQFVYVPNYGNSTVSTLKVASDGSLSAVGSPIAVGMQPYFIGISNDGQYAYVVNSGDNSVSTMHIAQDGTLSAVGSATVVGNIPSSIVFSVDGQFAFVANAGDGTVSTLAINNGSLSAVGSPLHVASAIEAMAVSADGQFAYTANGSDNTVSSLSITNGSLSVIGTVSAGNGANSVTVSPNGQFVIVANLNDGSISLFSSTNGVLTFIGQPVTGLGDAAFVTFSPNGQFFYVLDSTLNNVGAYSIDQAGNVTPVNTLAVGSGSWAMAISANGQFGYTANVNDNTVSILRLASGTPSDSWSTFANLQANPVNTAAALFALAPFPAVYSPMPSSAPTTLALP